MKRPARLLPLHAHRLVRASLLISSLLVAACGSGNGNGDAGTNARPDAGPPDLAPAYACPAALGSPDGGFAPSLHPAGAVPTLAAPQTPGTPPAIDVVFTIDTSKGMWPISPDIYGMNSIRPGVALDPTMRVTNERLGGNRLSAYNWENNASNAGKDYHYQNDGYLSSSNAAGDAVRRVLGDAWGMGAGAVVTVPIGDYVSADKAPGGDVRGDGSVGDGGVAYLQQRFRKNVATKGAAPVYPPDQNDDSVYQDEFVAWVKGCTGDVPVTFSLDNEPGLWSLTHPEIHASAVTYDELCERTVRFASAIKAVWPTAPVLGFVSYGWNGYTTLQNAPDSWEKGDFIDYFLDQMEAAGATAGQRLVDYLDLHWYPEATGGGARIVFSSAPTDPTKLAAYQDARVQAPRSLWDPSYVESSWITSSVGGAINLIPRMRQKIADHYPGTKLSFTEWNYGGPSDITGAIATADVVGIFGREKVDLADIWLLSSSEPFTFAAMKAFRNYDGQGGEFGDIEIAASNSNPIDTSVYASLSSSNPDQVVVVAINKKSDASVTAGIRLAHPASFASARVYELAGTKADLLPAPDLAASASNAFTYTMPAHSVSVLVFAGTGETPPVDGGAVDGGAVDGGTSDAPITPPVDLDAGASDDARAVLPEPLDARALGF